MSSNSTELDLELADLPEEFRRREFMRRIEAALFMSPEPMGEDDLRRLVSSKEVVGDLIADIRVELKGRPYDIVLVAGGWRFQTHQQDQAFVKAVFRSNDPGAPNLSSQDTLLLATVALNQPITRAEIGEALGREISRDALARLRRLGLIASGPRSPEPGAPVAYVSTEKFLQVFGLSSLSELNTESERVLAETHSNKSDALSDDIET